MCHYSENLLRLVPFAVVQAESPKKPGSKEEV